MNGGDAKQANISNLDLLKLTKCCADPYFAQYAQRDPTYAFMTTHASKNSDNDDHDHYLAGSHSGYARRTYKPSLIAAKHYNEQHLLCRPTLQTFHPAPFASLISACREPSRAVGPPNVGLELSQYLPLRETRWPRRMPKRRVRIRSSGTRAFTWRC